MKLSDEERSEHRAAFRAMSLAEKAEYVFAYYKLPLVLALVAVVALGWVVWRRLTYREPVLYVAYANVALGEELEQGVEQGFIAASGADARYSQVYAYSDLYLSNAEEATDHQYAYASKLKVIAATEAHELDVVLMNQEAYNLLSGSGYLLDLAGPVAGSSQAKALEPLLVSNQVILSDNAIEYELGEVPEYESELEEHANALRVTSSPHFAGLTLSDDVYLGIIANTPRMSTALAFAEYLVGVI